MLPLKGKDTDRTAIAFTYLTDKCEVQLDWSGVVALEVALQWKDTGAHGYRLLASLTLCVLIKTCDYDEQLTSSSSFATSD